MAVCQRMATRDSRNKPQTALPHDVAGDGGRSWSAGGPHMAIYPIFSGGVFAPVRRPTPHTYQRVAARCGCRRPLESLATPGRETRHSRRFRSCWTVLTSWVGSGRCWRFSQTDTPTGPFSNSSTQPFWNSSASVGNAWSWTTWCRITWDTQGCPSNWTKKCRSLRKHRNTEGGGNICPWHATRNTRDFKPLPADTPPRLLAMLIVARDHFVDVIWNRTETDLWPPFGWGASTRSSCFLMEMVWDVHVDSWVLQPVLGSWTGTWQAWSTSPKSCWAIRRHRACCRSLSVRATLEDDH